MTRFAIDPETLVWIAENHVVIGNHQLVAPNSIRSTDLDLVLGRVLRGEISEVQALQLHERMTATKIRQLGDRVSRRTAWRLAVDHGRETIALCEYVAVAKLQADALVTTTRELVALAHGLVPLDELSELLET